jgi:hypothetical protein
MALAQKRLAGPAVLGTSTAVLYTVPINVSTIVKQLLITNTTAAAKTVTVRLKPLNVTEAVTHDIVSAMTINANETMSISLSLVMNNNGSTSNATNSDQLTGFASASGVNLTVTGIEES